MGWAEDEVPVFLRRRDGAVSQFGRFDITGRVRIASWNRRTRPAAGRGLSGCLLSRRLGHYRIGTDHKADPERATRKTEHSELLSTDLNANNISSDTPGPFAIWRLIRKSKMAAPGNRISARKDRWR